jgi:hypothetical protein
MSKNETNDEFMQRLEMATQIHFLKKRIETLERERNNSDALLVKMWNTAVGWIIPRYTNYPKK